MSVPSGPTPKQGKWIVFCVLSTVLAIVFFICITERSGLKATEVQWRKQVITPYANGLFKLIISQRNKNPLFTIPDALFAAIEHVHHTPGNLNPLKLCRVIETLLLWCCGVSCLVHPIHSDRQMCFSIMICLHACYAYCVLFKYTSQCRVVCMTNTRILNLQGHGRRSHSAEETGLQIYYSDLTIFSFGSLCP